MQNFEKSLLGGWRLGYLTLRMKTPACLERVFPSAQTLLWILVVSLCPLFMAETVSAPAVRTRSVRAPSVTSAAWEMSADEFAALLAALQEIARASNRKNELPWPKVLLSGAGVQVVSGLVLPVLVAFLADLGKKKWPFWKCLKSPTLEDVIITCKELLTGLSDIVTKIGTTWTVGLNALEGFRAEEEKLMDEKEKKLEEKEKKLEEKEKKLEEKEKKLEEKEKKLEEKEKKLEEKEKKLEEKVESNREVSLEDVDVGLTSVPAYNRGNPDFAIPPGKPEPVEG